MSPFQIVCTALVAVGGVARVTRLLTWDVYPPVAFVRRWYISKMGESDWAVLAQCAYCAAPYVAAGDLAWGYFTHWQTAWFIVNTWLTVSYAAAITVRYDGDDD